MSLGKHTALNLAGNILPILVALITVPFYLKYVGTERYGILAIFWSLLGYFAFFDFGLGRAVTQRMSKFSETEKLERSNLLWTALIITFLLGMIGSVVLWAIADYILSNFIQMTDSSRNEAAVAVNWFLLALPLLLLGSVLQGALQARLRFTELNIIQIFGSTLGQLFPLFIAISGHVDLKELVPAVLAARLLTTCMLLYQCRHHVPISGRPKIDQSHLKPLIKYGGWISIISFLAPFLVTVDRIILGALNGAKAVSYYTIPYDLVSKTMLISGSLSSAIFPRLSALEANDGKNLAMRVTTILVTVMSLVVIIGLFAIKPFLNFWVGEQFASLSAGVPEIILIGVWINAFVIPHNARLLAQDSPKKVVVVYLIEIPVYLIALWYGVTHFGIIGAAGAWTLRVLLDATMLLNVSGCLKHTLRLMLPYTPLIFMAFIIQFVLEALTPEWFGLFVLCISICIVKDRENIIKLIYFVFNK